MEKRHWTGPLFVVVLFLLLRPNQHDVVGVPLSDIAAATGRFRHQGAAGALADPGATIRVILQPVQQPAVVPSYRCGRSRYLLAEVSGEMEEGPGVNCEGEL